MDDGFLQFHSILDLNVLKNALNNLHHPTKTFTIEAANFDNFSKTLVIRFFDITISLHENSYVEEIYFTRKRNLTIISIITGIIQTT